MNKEKLNEQLNELRSLYDCFLKLDYWFTSTESESERQAASAGRWAVIKNIRDILTNDDVFPIIAKDQSYPLEDFNYFIRQDTPQYIAKIQNYIDNEY